MRVSLSTQINLCKAAMQRRQHRMDVLWRSVSYPGQDEHEAALGGVHGEHHTLCEKQGRARKWLCVLLRKRGTAADLQLAKAVEWTAWP